MQFLDSSIASGQAYEDLEFGMSFRKKTWNLGKISGDVLFRSFSDNGNSAFDESTVNVGSIDGNLNMFTNTQNSFQLSTWTITNGIGGDVLMVDTASGGHGFCDSFFNFLGIISGSVSIRDQTPSTDASLTEDALRDPQNGLSTQCWGDLEFIEESEWGSSFYSSNYDVGFVGGSLSFIAKQDNNNNAFITS